MRRKGAAARPAAAKRRGKAGKPKTSASELTVSLPQFLHGGSDIEFRKFVADLFAAVAAMHSLRRALAASVGLNAAEYAILLVTWQLEKSGTASIGAIANNLHIAAANVTAGVAKLVRKGLLRKKRHPRDTRAVVVELTAAGQAILTELTPLLRRINDRLFSHNKPADIRAVSRFIQHLVEESAHAIRLARVFAGRSDRRPRPGGSSDA